MLGLMQSDNIALSTISKYLAIDRQIERHKEEYYFVLNACSEGKYLSNPTEYKTHYFIKFMMKMIELSLADIDIYRKRHQAVINLSPTAMTVLQCFREHPEFRITTKNLIELTAIPRRSITHSLKTLLNKQLIQKYGQGAGVRYQLTF